MVIAPNLKRLTQTMQHNAHPVWSPNGPTNRLRVQSLDLYGTDVCVAEDADGTNTVPAHRETAPRDGGPSWSLMVEFIVFHFIAMAAVILQNGCRWFPAHPPHQASVTTPAPWSPRWAIHRLTGQTVTASTSPLRRASTAPTSAHTSPPPHRRIQKPR